MRIIDTEKIRVLIVDDHSMVLLGMKSCLSLEPGIEIVGEARSGVEALEKARALVPDIVIMDISMPGLGGLEAARQLHDEMPDSKVIILSMYEDGEYISQFLQSDASGYVLKKGSPDELLDAIRAVHAGGAYFSPSVAQIILKDRQKGKDYIQELTAQETRVLTLLARGHNTKQIADMMFLSPRTIAKYRELMMMKLDIHSIAGLTRYAISKRLITPDQP